MPSSSAVPSLYMGPDTELLTTLIHGCKFTLVVLDHEGLLFRRLWCIFEIIVTMQSDR